MNINTVSLGKRAGAFAAVLALQVLTQIQKSGTLPRTGTQWALIVIASLIASIPFGQDPTGFKAAALDGLKGLQDILNAPAAKREQVAKDREAALLLKLTPAAEAAAAKKFKELTQEFLATKDGLVEKPVEVGIAPVVAVPEKAIAPPVIIAPPTPNP